ncbi:phenylalanine--tRNA ligase subunit beta [Mechercharimyces sp. CAU 1602]|uniref:phenylalanine--tRNA ligase subunit beta n=1 Tax=Mechercharimyces sp. CAU 1602 TaxID=2973933 RepID=UPI002163EB43|nr:phenylalanine--tRNA ligase subunit beta [Mechercharimyces sp. CAU 1602]MCS1351553.1 phenylalanine--tRNA ligase subunit beta [Mechercharimyces sp. CAU 1602]
MKISTRWLQEVVSVQDIAVDKIADKCTFGGIEVEGVESRNKGVSKVLLGRVVSVKAHPDADKLRICFVDIGEEEDRQIVCGAPNVAEGQWVPVAIEGARLPGGMKIKRSKLRGVESRGMICSAKEIGLEEKLLPKGKEEGILVLNESDAPVGTPITDVLELDDQIMELGLTPNRSDCLSMWGMAYEVAALFERDLSIPQAEELQPGIGAVEHIEIHLQAEEECPLYAGQVVDVKIAPSPQWMQNRLMAMGIRPVNNVVDITNYVMLEYGQPLHAFDYDRINAQKIKVRHAFAEERIQTLDGVERILDEEMLVIADGQDEPLALAGIMGGSSSEVTAETTRVLVESAYFTPTMVRQTSRKLGLRTEASNRFDKGVDPERVIPALQRTVQLLVELAGGSVRSSVTSQHVGGIEDVTISLKHERLTTLLGVQIHPEEVEKIFHRLRFDVKREGEQYFVTVPSRRQDVTLDVDLIEEVARLYGYDRLPTTLPWGKQSPGGLTKDQQMRRVIRQTLRSMGMHEVKTYSLTKETAGKEMASITGKEQPKPIPVMMPMSREHSVLRTSLLPHLIEVASYNIKRQHERVSLFEIGRTYINEKDDLLEQPYERWELSGLLTGDLIPSNWNMSSPPIDFFVAKGVLHTLFMRLGIEEVEYQAAQPVGFHPGRTAQMVLAGEVIGLIGQLHPLVADQHGLEDTVICQIDLSLLFQVAGPQIKFEALKRHPAVSRDLALVVGEDVPSAQIETAILSVGGEWLERVNLFDVFAGNQIGAGKKSVAYALTYRHPERTLTDEEVHQMHGKIVQHITETLGAELRQ